MKDKLTSLSEAHPARISASPGSDWDSRVAEASSLWTLYEFAVKLEQDGSFGRTSPQLYPAITVKTSQNSSPSLPDGISLFPQEVGEKAESSPRQKDISAWPTEYLTLNTPEFPNFRELYRNEGNVSSLSDILVTGKIPARYYLSVKCAVGILRRAERRGRTLPEILKAALIRQTQSASAAESPEVARVH